MIFEELDFTSDPPKIPTFIKSEMENIISKSQKEMADYFMKDTIIGPSAEIFVTLENEADKIIRESIINTGRIPFSIIVSRKAFADLFLNNNLDKVYGAVGKPAKYRYKDIVITAGGDKGFSGTYEV